MADKSPESISVKKTAVALKAVCYCMAQWECSELEQQQLLDLEPSSFRRLLSGDHAEMTAETLLRISYLMGIGRALHTLYPTEERAAQRIRLATTDEPFAGQSPLALMLTGSLEGLALTRKYFDGRAQEHTSESEHQC